MSQFVIGTTEEKPLRCDLTRLIDTRLLVQANSGGGKSWCLRRLLEQTHGQVQHLVLDPEGEFATLRERFDYVLAAPKGADTAADPRTAALLAERLLELRVSAILDLYELRAHERVRFVRLFLDAMVNAPKRLWHPALVVIDEAHVYCPQQGEAESAGAVIDLATRGRKRGFCAVLATQRLAKLHKDAAAECNNVLIGRTALDVDMKRASDVLGFSTREDQHRLRTLSPGEFFTFGPALTTTVTRARVGDVRTSHPKAGARLGFEAPPPTDKVKAMLPKLADLPAEAEERQRSLDDLKRELAQARRELTAAKRAQPTAPPPKVTTREVSVLKPKDAEALAHAASRLEAAGQVIATAVEKAVERQREAAALAGEIRQALRQVAAQRGAAPPAAPRPPAADRQPTPRPVRAPMALVSTNGDGKLTGPEQRILDALAWLESIGVTPAEEAAAAFLAGYTIGGGAWNNPRGALRTKGLIAYKPGSRLELTDDGRAHARIPDAPLTTAELHRAVLDRLPGPEAKLLKALLAAYPEPITTEDLAQRSGYEVGGGAFNNPRGRLRTLGLIDYPDRGMVAARALLFLD